MSNGPNFAIRTTAFALRQPRRSAQEGAHHLHRQGGQGDPTFDTAQAIAVMLEKHGFACDLMHDGERQKAEV